MDINDKTVIYSLVVFYSVENYGERRTDYATQTLIIIKCPVNPLYSSCCLAEKCAVARSVSASLRAECSSSEGFKSGVALNREGSWTNQIAVHGDVVAVVVVVVIRRFFPSVYASTRRRLDINSLAADKPFLK